MKVYLAAAWSRKNEIKKIADELIELGIDIQARWLNEPNGGKHASSAFLQSRAEIDLDDVDACDVLVRFSDDLSAPTVSSHLATGSRMFEMGLAYHNGATIIVVGGHQCVFDYLEDIVHLPDVDALKMYLSGSHGNDDGSGYF